MGSFKKNFFILLLIILKFVSHVHYIKMKNLLQNNCKKLKRPNYKTDLESDINSPKQIWTRTA